MTHMVQLLLYVFIYKLYRKKTGRKYLKNVNCLLLGGGLLHNLKVPILYFEYFQNFYAHNCFYTQKGKT